MLQNMASHVEETLLNTSDHDSMTLLQPTIMLRLTFFASLHLKVVQYSIVRTVAATDDCFVAMIVIG